MSLTELDTALYAALWLKTAQNTMLDDADAGLVSEDAIARAQALAKPPCDAPALQPRTGQRLTPSARLRVTGHSSGVH